MPAQREKAAVVAALLAITLGVAGGCNHGPTLNGEFNVSWTWADGTLQRAIVEPVRTREPVSHAARKEITKAAQWYVADRIRRSDLKRAEGRLRLTLYGPPPYFEQLVEFLIIRPDFFELSAAVELEDIEKIRHLVATDDNVNQRELPSERTALAIAAAGGHPKSVKALLDLGADPNSADNIGVTPLMNAVLAGSEESIRALLAAGSRVDQVNAAGDSAVSLAKKSRRKKILSLLVR